MKRNIVFWGYLRVLLLLPAVLGICADSLAQDGVYFAVKLLPDKVTYQVSLSSTVGLSGSSQLTNSGQVTIVTKANSFTMANIHSTSGAWSNNTTVRAPSQNPGYDYFIFGLTPNATTFPYSATGELVLFTFTNSGPCAGPVEIWTKNDPFQPNPPTQPINVGNDLTALGFRNGSTLYNAWLGNYAVGSANCAIPPTIAIVTPALNATLSTPTVLVSGTATAGASVTLTEGSTQLCTTQAATDGSWGCTLLLADGLHAVTGVASNLGGVSNPATTVFSVSSTCPPTKCVPITITLVKRRRL